MNQPTKEQKQWFWEQCGLEIADKIWVEDHYEPDGRWYDLDGKVYEGDYLYGIPVIDLNNLFRYAVPKLMGLSWKRYCDVMLRWVNDFLFDNKDPALVLFWAIYKALGGKE